MALTLHTLWEDAKGGRNWVLFLRKKKSPLLTRMFPGYTHASGNYLVFCGYLGKWGQPTEERDQGYKMTETE